MLKFQHYCSNKNVTCRKTGYATFFEDFFPYYQEVKRLIKRFLNSRQVSKIRDKNENFETEIPLNFKKIENFSALILLKTADFCEFNIRLLWVQSTLIRVYIYIHNILTLIIHIYNKVSLYIYEEYIFYITHCFSKKTCFLLWLRSPQITEIFSAFF